MAREGVMKPDMSDLRAHIEASPAATYRLLTGWSNAPGNPEKPRRGLHLFQRRGLLAEPHFLRYCARPPFALERLRIQRPASSLAIHEARKGNTVLLRASIVTKGI
jgi:hypothetical protein